VQYEGSSPEDLDRLRRRLREGPQPEIVAGHFPFGIHESLPHPAEYITFLRDPIRRVLSLYDFTRTEVDHRLHDRVVSEGITLGDYVTTGITVEVDNHQTRLLSGEVDRPFGRCSERMLEAAKANLRDHVRVIGLTERFDESLLLIGHELRLSRPHYSPLNHAVRRHRVSPTPQEIQSIRDLNELDVRLYGYAAERFADAIDAAGPTFGRELARFRAVNRLYRPIGAVSYGLPRYLYHRGRALIHDRTAR